MANRRFLLCRPSGGLTDTLCQVERCWSYAAQTGRALIIDATQSGLWGNFADYFSTKPSAMEVISSPGQELFARLDVMSCHPAMLRGRLQKYACRWDVSMRALVDAETGGRLSFEFGDDYAEDLLVHHQPGGDARDAFSLLQRVVFVDSLARQIRDKLALFGSDYDAIHIRNSDARTDWRPFLVEVAAKLTAQAVLVCSDDCRVIRFCQEFFRDRKLLVSTMPPDTQGKALHTHEFAMSAVQRTVVVHDALVDLLALASGATLWYPMTEHGYPSGYSELARHLYNHKDVVRALLSSHASQRVA